MKITLSLLFSLMFSALFAQDTTYFNSEGDTVNTFKLANKYTVLERDTSDTNIVVVREYFASGEIISEKNYNPYLKKTLHGKKKVWFKSGQLRWDIDYTDGKLNGELVSYWDNDSLKRKDIFKEGELVTGQCWDYTGKRVDYYDFEKLPEFRGGESKMYKYLAKNMKYPNYSRDHNIQGRVIVSFVVEKNGRISNVKIIQSVSKRIDKEAIRVVKDMPKWTPGRMDGNKVRYRFNLPIKFALE